MIHYDADPFSKHYFYDLTLLYGIVSSTGTYLQIRLTLFRANFGHEWVNEGQGSDRVSGCRRDLWDTSVMMIGGR